MANDKKQISFEENLKMLEDIVGKLEGTNVTLDEMLGLFEKGIHYTKECREQLKNAEQKITVLVKDAGGEYAEQPFDVQ